MVKLSQVLAEAGGAIAEETAIERGRIVRAAPKPTPEPAAFAPRRSTDREIACAIDLGWRLAELHGLQPSELPLEPAIGVLPLRTSLSQSDRLQLELRAAAGDAERVGAPIASADLQNLAELTKQPESHWRLLSEGIRDWHISLEKTLWADQEAKGKAYELGNFLSDTWNRMIQALRSQDTGEAGGGLGGDGTPKSVPDELREVFSETRVQRIKILLDDLQTRIDPAAVRIVQRHLDAWRERVEALGPAHDDRPLPFEQTREGLAPLERQTLIWRQLVTGDKEPEAYLGREERARVRDVMAKRMAEAFWRHKKTIVAVSLGVAVVAAGVVQFWDPIASFYEHHRAAAGAITAFVGSVVGALGLSATSITATVRKSLDARAELIWHTALAELVCDQTSCVDQLLKQPEPAPTEQVHGPLWRLRATMDQLRLNSRGTPQP